MKQTALFAALGALAVAFLACASEPKDVIIGTGTSASALGGLGEPPKPDGTCDVRLTPCSGICVDLTGDPANCGACGNACLAAQTCTSGACVSPPSRDGGPQ